MRRRCRAARGPVRRARAGRREAAEQSRAVGVPPGLVLSRSSNAASRRPTARRPATASVLSSSARACVGVPSDGLATLHQLQQVVLEVALAPRERCQLVLEVGHLLRVRPAGRPQLRSRSSRARTASISISCQAISRSRSPGAVSTATSASRGAARTVSSPRRSRPARAGCAGGARSREQLGVHLGELEQPALDGGFGLHGCPSRSAVVLGAARSTGRCDRGRPRCRRYSQRRAATTATPPARTSAIRLPSGPTPDQGGLRPGFRVPPPGDAAGRRSRRRRQRARWPAPAGVPGPAAQGDRADRLVLLPRAGTPGAVAGQHSATGGTNRRTVPARRPATRPRRMTPSAAARGDRRPQPDPLGESAETPRSTTSALVCAQ